TAGAFNVLPLENDVAEKLVSDDRLKMLTFTGSAKVGWALKQKAEKKKVTLELGGNAGVIVHSDADVTYAAERCVAGGFGYSGQTCISVQRIYVQQTVYEKFLSTLVAGVKKLRMGNPSEDSTDVGPLINEGAARRVEEWIKEAAGGGAR